MDWTVHVDVEVLEPGTTYFHGFAVGENRSPVGRTRTLPDGDASAPSLRFAFTASPDRPVAGGRERSPTVVEVVTTSLTSQNLDEKLHITPRTEALPIETRFVEAILGCSGASWKATDTSSSTRRSNAGAASDSVRRWWCNTMNPASADCRWPT